MAETVSAGYLNIVDTLTLSNTSAGAIKAANINFLNLTATTQASGDSSTNVATTAFVGDAVTHLLDGAGPAYDTLKELSNIMQTDEGNLVSNIAIINSSLDLKANTVDVTSGLLLKANIAGPDFTGVPMINGSNIATVDYVNTLINDISSNSAVLSNTFNTYVSNVLSTKNIIDPDTPLPTPLNVYSSNNGIADNVLDNVVTIKNSSGDIIDHGHRIADGYFLSYDTSNNAVWTLMSDTSIGDKYKDVYSESPSELNITSRYSTYITEGQELVYSPTDILQTTKKAFEFVFDKGYSLPIADYNNAFKHMYAGYFRINDTYSDTAYQYMYSGIEFGYASAESVIPNNIYLSFAPDARFGYGSIQTRSFNGGFYLTNKENATDSNLYLNPVTIPVTTDIDVFQSIYGLAAGSSAFYDPIKSQVHIYFSGSSNTVSIGQTSAAFNEGTDGTGLTWNEKCEMVKFSGSFAIMKKVDDVVALTAPFIPATSFDNDSFLIQISDDIKTTFNAYDNDVPVIYDNTSTTGSRDKYCIEYTYTILQNIYHTIGGDYYSNVSVPEPMICPKVGNGSKSFDINTKYSNGADAFAEQAILPIIGDNAYTKRIENVSQSSEVRILNGNGLSTLFQKMNYSNLFTSTPETMASEVTAEMVTTDVLAALDTAIVHEIGHICHDLNYGQISRTGSMYANGEGNSTGIEMQRCRETYVISGDRELVWSLYLRNLLRGAYALNRIYITYTGELHNMGAETFFTQYGESMLNDYIIQKYDKNCQISRYIVESVTQSMKDTLALSNYPMQLSLVRGSAQKLVQNKYDEALTSITTALGSTVTLSNAFTDFCVSVSLLRNNTEIPEKYRSTFPYWTFNRHNPCRDKIDELSIFGGDIAFWSDTLEGIPTGSWPAMTAHNFNYSPYDTIHPIWPKVGSEFSDALKKNNLGSWADPADIRNSTFTYTTDTYITAPLVHQVEDLTCVSYVIPIQDTGSSMVYGTTDKISNVNVTVTKGEWTFKVVQYVPDDTQKFYQTFEYSVDGGANWLSGTEVKIDITDSTLTLPSTWSEGTSQTIKIRFNGFKGDCHGTDWHGVDVWYFPRLVCVHRKNYVYNEYRSIYPAVPIYSGKMTLQANVA